VSKLDELGGLKGARNHLSGMNPSTAVTDLVVALVERVEELETELTYIKALDVEKMEEELISLSELAEMVEDFEPYAPGTTLRVFDERRLLPLKTKARECLARDEGGPPCQT
jgi:hypothetical protein